MATLKFLNENNQWEVAETPGAIKYTEQNLSEEQKAQARANIGAENIEDSLGGGSKAFKVISVDDINKTITLDSVEGLEVGYLCSAQISNNYNAFGKITDINENTVTFDETPTGYTIEEASVLWVPYHPELGTQEIGSYATIFGYNNKANAACSFVVGQDNVADGKRSFAAGRDNYAGYLGTAFGQENKVTAFNGTVTGNKNNIEETGSNSLATGYQNTIQGINSFASGSGNWATGANATVLGQTNTAGGDNSFAGGNGSQTYHNRGFVYGLGLYTACEGQSVLGSYNSLSETDVFQFGIGDADNGRKNGLALDENGNLSVYNILSNCGSPNKTYWSESSHSFVSGQSNSLRGANTFATGYGNWVTGKNAMVMGNQSQASGMNSFGGGNQSRVYNSNGFVFGDNLNLSSSNVSGAAAFGKYNQDSTSNVLEVGIGTSDSNRKNGFAVTTDGRATVATNPINAMDVATKQYVDTKSTDHTHTVSQITDITPASIGAAASSHTHSNYSTTSHTHTLNGSSLTGILPVTKGGTNADTVEGARENLGVNRVRYTTVTLAVPSEGETSEIFTADSNIIGYTLTLKGVSSQEGNYGGMETARIKNIHIAGYDNYLANNPTKVLVWATNTHTSPLYITVGIMYITA